METPLPHPTENRFIPLAGKTEGLWNRIKWPEKETYVYEFMTEEGTAVDVHPCPPDGCVVLICISPIKGVEHLFMRSLTFAIPLGKMFKSFVHFSDGLSVFFSLIYNRSLDIPKVQKSFIFPIVRVSVFFCIHGALCVLHKKSFCSKIMKIFSQVNLESCRWFLSYRLSP